MSDADGVADRHLERTHLDEGVRDLGDAGRWHVALERTPERRRDVRPDPHPKAGGAFAHGGVRHERRVDRLIDVLPAEGLGRGRKDGHLGDTRGVRPVEP